MGLLSALSRWIWLGVLPLMILPVCACPEMDSDCDAEGVRPPSVIDVAVEDETPTQFRVNWAYPEFSGAQTVAVVLSENTPLTETPDPCVTLVVGEQFVGSDSRGGTVIAVDGDAINRLAVRSTLENGRWCYNVYTQALTGVYSLPAAACIDNRAPIDATTPTTTVSNFDIELDWPESAEDYWTGTLILREQDAMTSQPTDAEEYMVGDMAGDAEVVAVIPVDDDPLTDDSIYADTPPTSGTWCYQVYYFNRTLRYGAGESVCEPFEKAPLEVENALAQSFAYGIDLTWDLPTDPSRDRVIMRRYSASVTPEPAGGVGVCDPCTSPHTHDATANSLTLGDDYYFYIYTVRTETGTPIYSRPVEVFTPYQVFELNTPGERPTAAAAQDRSGWSAAIDGNTAVVGAPWNDTNGANAGAVYVYEFTPGDQTWSQPVALPAPTTPLAALDEFGFSVDIAGNFIVVGAPGSELRQLGSTTDPPASTSPGRAFVYEYDGTNWNFREELVPAINTLTADDAFGYRVELSPLGNGLVISAPGQSGQVGAVYAYIYDNGLDTWDEQATVATPVGLPAPSYYGESLTLVDNFLLVGSPRASQLVPSNFFQIGSVQVVELATMGFIADVPIPGMLQGNELFFGYSMAATSGVLFVGAPGANLSGAAKSGIVLSYSPPFDSATLQQQIQSANRDINGFFGHDVAISNGLLLVSAPRSLMARGTVVTFDANQVYREWTTVVSTASVVENFGYALAAAGDLVVMGSPLEPPSGPLQRAGSIFLATEADLLP